MSDPRRSRRGPPQIALPGTALCVLPRCGQPRSYGLQLCTDCVTDLRRMLDGDWLGDRDEQLPASIPVYWSRLDPTLRTTGLANRRAPGFHSTPPLDLDVVVMRDPRSRSWPVVPVWWPARPGDGKPDHNRPHFEAEGEPRSVVWILTAFAEALWEHLGPPEALPPASGFVHALCRWLWQRVDDIAGHPDAGALVEDLVELRDQLRNATGDPLDRPTGRCTGLVSVQGNSERVSCNHPLYLPPPRPGVTPDPRAPVLRCGRCFQPYTHLQLLRMELVGPSR